MRKILTCLWLMLSVFAMTACGSEDTEPKEPELPDNENVTDNGTSGRTLIVFFSWGGNTRGVAEQVHDLIGGDMVEVETVVPYPDTYEEVTKIAPVELANDFRPELKTKVDNMEEYDILIVGTPIWGSHLAPAMKSFLASYDLSGKTIAPFCTHGGSGTAQSVNDIRSVCPDNVTVLESLAIYGNRGASSRNDVERWLNRIGIIKQLLLSAKTQNLAYTHTHTHASLEK